MAYSWKWCLLEGQGRVSLLKFEKTQENNRENPNSKGLGATGSAKGYLERVGAGFWAGEGGASGTPGTGRALLWLWIVVKSVALEFLVMQSQDNHCSSSNLFVFFRPFHALPMAVIS